MSEEPTQTLEEMIESGVIHIPKDAPCTIEYDDGTVEHFNGGHEIDD